MCLNRISTMLYNNCKICMFVNFIFSVYTFDCSFLTCMRLIIFRRNEISLLSATPCRKPATTSSHVSHTENKKSSKNFIRNSLSRKSWSKAMTNVKRFVSNPSEIVGMGRQSTSLLRWKPHDDLSGCDRDVDQIMCKRNTNATPIKFSLEKSTPTNRPALNPKCMTPKPRNLLNDAICSSGRTFLVNSLRRSSRLRSKRFVHWIWLDFCFVFVTYALHALIWFC